MLKLKLAVIGAFTILVIGAALSRTEFVSGQTGGSSLAAPTAVLATDNLYNTKVGIYWDVIRGATAYRIFRNATNTPSGATDLGTTAAPYFFDAGAAPGQTFFYWVRAENGSTVSALSSSDSGARTGAAQQGPIPPLQPPPAPPTGNNLTAAKAYLGKVLFWDEQMSSTRTVSCATCHHSGSGGSDPRTLSTNPGPDGVFNNADDIHGSAGVPSNNADGTYVSLTTYGLNDQVTGRKTVSYVNAGYAPVLFWDGRATGTFKDPVTGVDLLIGGAALESQSAGPPTSSAEMANTGRTWTDVAARMAASKPLALSPSVPTALTTWIDGRTYPQLFDEAFGTSDVTPSRISFAIATFERTLFSDQAPVDIANAGGAPLTTQEQNGRNIFNNRAGCNRCHGGNLLTDNNFHFIGVRPPTDDTGRFQVTGNPGDTGDFRTPSLRNVELRKSFFHNGEFTTLEQVVAFYSRGGDFHPNELGPPLNLTAQEQADLVAFLKRPLTDPRVAAESAPFDRPTLYTESSRVPQITGTGRVGSGGFTPQVKAISPPLVGNPNFTISLSTAVGNANATLVVNSTDPGLPKSIPTTGSLARVTTTTQNTAPGTGWASVSLAIPDSAAVVGQTFYARWYVVDPNATSGFSVSPAARFTVFGDATQGAVTRAKFVDFDGDGKTDISVFRPGDGDWWILRSSDGGAQGVHWGISSDKVAPADYDGDGKVDLAVYRDGIWYILGSRDGYRATSFGLVGDIPQPGDYDGDGRADVAVFRPTDGNWYALGSQNGFLAVHWGASTDRPVAADYDGDGKTDPAVYRNGTWWILKSTGGPTTGQWGLPDDKPVIGDYDGDGRSDMAVWRPSNGVWYAVNSSDGTFQFSTFGLATDVPTPGDYDGDGKFDPAVYRPGDGTWYVSGSTRGFSAARFGLGSDEAVPGYVVP